MKNKKKMAQNLRKRAEVRKREATLAIQLSKKLEEEGKHEEASATRMAAAEDIKIADKWIKTANEMDPIEEEPQEESSTFEWAPPDEEPIEEETSDEEPSDEEPIEEETSDEEPSDEEPIEEETSDEEPSNEESIEEETSDEEPFDEEPIEEETSDEESSDEEPIEEETSDEEPSDEEPIEEETSDEEPSDEEPAEEETSNEGTDNSKPAWFHLVHIGLLGCIAVLLALIVLLSQCNGTSDNPDQITDDTTDGVVDTTDTEDPDETETPSDVEEPFDIDAFVSSVVNIADQLTDEDDVSANTNIFVENIGEDKIESLVDEFGELQVQKAIAEMLAFVPEIRMNQYVANNGLDYNPNAAEDYDLKLQAADTAYKAATGKNPDGALMSLEGYDTHKSNRDAIKALIVESGDKELLTWYNVKTEEYDVMKQQIRDTETAEAYKEEVKLELINSTGTIKLLELQLEKVADGTLKVMDDVTLEYTDSYEQFILGNYMYVIAG